MADFVPLSAAAVARVAEGVARSLAENAADPAWRGDDGRVAATLDVSDLIHWAGDEAAPAAVEAAMPAVLARLRLAVPGADWSDNGAAGWDWAVLFSAPPDSLAG